MPTWDIFHGDRLELERGLTAAAIHEALERGAVRDDDLVRPAGTTGAWTRLADLPELLAPEPKADQRTSEPGPIPVERQQSAISPKTASTGDFEFQAADSGPNPIISVEPKVDGFNRFSLKPDSDVTFPVINDFPPEAKLLPGGLNSPGLAGSAGWVWAEDDEALDAEEVDDEFDDQPAIVVHLAADGRDIVDDGPADAGENRSGSVITQPPAEVGGRSSRLALPVVTSRGWDDTGSDEDEPEEDTFSLSRSGPETVEELDLAPMVDVAFQLVLFFMVAAQTVLYKTLEIPKPTQEQAPSAVAQGQSRTLDDLKDDFILVEIDATGAMKLDRQPVTADMNTLVERLRATRESTHRKAMLLSADFATAHRNSVLAYDAANEIGLGIVIARPATPQGPAPTLIPGRPAPKSAPPRGAAAGSVPN